MAGWRQPRADRQPRTGQCQTAGRAGADRRIEPRLHCQRGTGPGNPPHPAQTHGACHGGGGGKQAQQPESRAAPVAREQRGFGRRQVVLRDGCGRRRGCRIRRSWCGGRQHGRRGVERWAGSRGRKFGRRRGWPNFSGRGCGWRGRPGLGPHRAGWRDWRTHRRRAGWRRRACGRQHGRFGWHRSGRNHRVPRRWRRAAGGGIDQWRQDGIEDIDQSAALGPDPGSARVGGLCLSGHSIGDGSSRVLGCGRGAAAQQKHEQCCTCGRHLPPGNSCAPQSPAYPTGLSRQPSVEVDHDRVNDA